MAQLNSTQVNGDLTVTGKASLATTASTTPESNYDLTTKKYVDDQFNELNGNIETLQNRNSGTDGSALKIYDKPDNLTNGCYGVGIYLFSGYYPGAPSDWGGYMISLGVNQGDKKHIKYAFCIDGSVYFMRQVAGTGAIEQNWAKIAGIN